MRIIAIDPGNTQSGYVVVEHDGVEIRQVVEKGKVDNDALLGIIWQHRGTKLALEMVASYGMPVGAEVFETCVWIGRFMEAAIRDGGNVELIYRREEKLYLCGTMQAKDSNIIQALVDRFAPGQPNRGKGTKKAPGFFYGFNADVWQACAVAVAYFDKCGRGIKL